MKTWRQFGLGLGLLAILDCGDDGSAALRVRARQFGDLLLQLSEMSEMAARSKLEDFVEPSEGRSERIVEYYQDFSSQSQKWRVTQQSVERVNIDFSGKAAEVTYRTVARGPSGQEVVASQLTRWKRVNGIWYREPDLPEKRLEPR